NAETMKQIGPEFEHRAFAGPGMSPDESRVITWSGRFARQWTISGQPIGRPLDHGASIEGAVYSNDGNRVFTWGGDGKVRVWKSSTGKETGPGITHGKIVNKVILSHDDSRFVSMSNDESGQLWNAVRGTPIGPRLAATGAVFSPDGNRLLTWYFAGDSAR